MRRFRSALLAVVVSAVVGGACAIASIYHWELYGWTLFFMVPAAIGWVSAAVLLVRGPATLVQCVVAGTAAVALLALGFLVFALEGLICLLMAAPLVMPFVALGSWLGWIVLHHRHREPRVMVTSATAIVFMTVALLAAESRLPRDVHGLVEDSVLIQAPADATWNAVVELGRVPARHDWVYRAGIARPEDVRIVAPREGGIRLATFSTGVLIEQIEVWEPEKMLRWRPIAVPPPLRETNPFHDHVSPPHLRREFYDSPAGEIALSRVTGRATTLTRRTWYRHRLHPVWYWNFWSELAISRVHRTVLEHVRTSAEGKSRV